MVGSEFVSIISSSGRARSAPFSNRGLPALSFSKTVILGMSISRSICSDCCHAAPVFLTSGKTGYIDIMENNLIPRFETGWKEWDFCVGEG